MAAYPIGMQKIGSTLRLRARIYPCRKSIRKKGTGFCRCSRHNRQLLFINSETLAMAPSRHKAGSMNVMAMLSQLRNGDD